LRLPNSLPIILSAMNFLKKAVINGSRIIPQVPAN
jgi:hypothetical protein